MKVQVINECGYEEALLGISLSFNQELDKMPSVARNLAFKQGGHNKFLESMVVWVDLTAPLYWWTQMATYRVGTSFNSESTMHTLLRTPLTEHMFEGEDTSIAMLSMLNSFRSEKDLVKLKQHLPCSFLQRRIMTTNYKTLQNMVNQRSTHKMIEWHTFIQAILDGVEHPHFLWEGSNNV